MNSLEEVVPEILYDKNRRSSLVFWCEKEGFTLLDTKLDTKALGLNGLPLPLNSLSPKAKVLKYTSEERCGRKEWRPTAMKVVINRDKDIKRIMKKHA